MRQGKSHMKHLPNVFSEYSFSLFFHRLLKYSAISNNPSLYKHRQKKICRQYADCSKDLCRPIQHAPKIVIVPASIARPDKSEDIMRERNGSNWI
jgi:hypothetical protein